MFFGRINCFFELTLKSVFLHNRMRIFLGKCYPVVVLIITFLAFDHRHFEFYFDVLFWEFLIVALFLSFLEDNIISFEKSLRSIGFPSFQTDFSTKATFPHSVFLHYNSIGNYITDGFEFALTLLQRNVFLDIDHNYLCIILYQFLPKTFVGA